jgi:hypothetical protein
VAAILGRQGQRQPGQPEVEEGLDRDGAKAVARPQQQALVVTGGESGGQRRLRGRAFGPLMPVEPHLDRTRKVGADLMNPRTEVDVPDKKPSG